MVTFGLVIIIIIFIALSLSSMLAIFDFDFLGFITALFWALSSLGLVVFIIMLAIKGIIAINQ